MFFFFLYYTNERSIYIYIALPIIFVIVFHFFVNYKLYSQEKYKVGISLFIAFNVLLTGFIFVKQNSYHKEDITNELIKNNDKFLDDLFVTPLKELHLFSFKMPNIIIIKN